MKGVVDGLCIQYPRKRIRLLFQDEAGFGRINKPKHCWCAKGIRPQVPCHHIREYRYAYGAVEPLTGEHFFLVMPYCNTECMNVFLKELSEEYKDDLLVLVCDGAAWHKSNALQIPSNVTITYIPPYTPEMNPIEQIWRELRTQGFCNEVFQTLDAVIDRLCATIQKLTRNTVWSITSREWICNIF
uniref:IS630 family transposase n=1 Tax=Selenomonas sp. TAMA-11512 TaxID=3095337 RepID=UPI00403F0AE0